MPDTAKFCAACGAPVADKEQADISSTGETVDKENHTKRIAGIAVASALALVVMIAGGAAFHANRNTDKTESVSAVTSETRPPEAESVPEPETVINTGFVTQDGELYYYGADGEPANGWIEDNGSRYYAADEGRIYRNGTFEIDGTQYIFDEAGICIGDEKTFAEEDAKLLQDVNGQSSLAGLMYVLVHDYIGGGFHDYDSVTSEEVQARLNSLLNGEPEGIMGFFEGEVSGAQNLSYTYENQPSNYQELHQQYGNEYFLTKEQIEYLVYSICGKQVDLDLSQDDRWHDPYLGFGGCAGDTTWNGLRNFSVERAGADTWQVRADVYYGVDGWSLYVDQYLDLVGKVNFTVIRNHDSYFDGYSIANAEVELTGEDAVWKDAYLMYIENFDWQINDQIDTYVSDYGMGAQEKADMRARIQYDLIYINDDDIPELYIEYPIDPPYQEARMITYYDGQLIVSEEEYYWSFCEYIEGSGLVYGEHDQLEHYEYGVYKLENGRWQTIGSAYENTNLPYFEWNGTEVSSYEEIERNINAIYDMERSRECGNDMSVFDLIKLIYQDAELTFWDDKYYDAMNDSTGSQRSTK